MEKGLERAKVLAFCNHKGGVGKTCTAANIGAGLVKEGKEVLLVDLDPQANLTSSFGIIPPEKINVYQLLVGGIKPERSILNIYKGLDIIPGTLDLAGAEIELSNEIARESIVREKINQLRGIYDYILIDCPPSLGIFTMNALVCADEAIVPLNPDPFSIDGVENLEKLIDKIRVKLNKSLKVGGVLITRFDGRKNLSKDLSEVIEDYFMEKTFKTKIRDNISLVEANQCKKDIFRYNEKSYGAMDYSKVCEEILSKN